MDLHDAVQTYLISREVDGFAVNTIRNDRRTLTGFAAVCPVGATTRALTGADIDRYLTARQNAGCGPGTLNVDLSALRAFMTWLRSRGVAPHIDPVSSKRWHKVERKLPLYLPVEDFGRILDCADHPVNRMIVATGLYLFTRASETQAIRLRDLDMANSSISVRVQKTNDLDVMPISAEYGAELRTFLRWYESQVGDLHHDYCLHPRKLPKNNRFCPGEYVINPHRPVARIADAINEVLVKAGYPAETGNDQGAHTLRRSGAVALYRELSEQRGHDGAIRIVSTMLHHANISMTEVYLDLRLDRVSRDKIIKGQRMFTGRTVQGLRVVQ